MLDTRKIACIIAALLLIGATAGSAMAGGSSDNAPKPHRALMSAPHR